jgi:hypothetical protein
MSSWPIREPQDTSSTDESSTGALSASDHDTDHHDYLINNSPAFFRPSNSSHDREHDHDHDHASDFHFETPSEHSDPSDHVSEASDGSHMDWSPISPVISAPGQSGTSSDDDVDADANDITAETTAETPENLPDTTTLLPLPTSSPGHLTYAHQQAMANRIIYDQILPGAHFDPAVYTPVFLHDTLMLPGSLATVIGKVRYPVSITSVSSFN